MLGYIVYDKIGYERNKSFVEISIDFMRNHGVNLVFKYDFEILPVINVDGNELFQNKFPDFVIMRTINPRLSYFLESMNIRVFNSYVVSKIANDKARASVLAKRAGIKTIPSLFLDVFPSEDIVFRLHRHFNNNEIIIKSINGHGGSEVFCICNDEKLGQQNSYSIVYNSISEKLRNTPCIVQPRISGDAKDMRVYILDNKPVAAVLRTNKCSYKSNYSLGGDAKLVEIPDEIKSDVLKICNGLYMDYSGIDFLIDENNNFYFNEIEDCVGARMLYATSDIDIIGMFMAHIIDKISLKNI